MIRRKRIFDWPPLGGQSIRRIAYGFLTRTSARLLSVEISDALSNLVSVLAVEGSLGKLRRPPSNEPVTVAPSFVSGYSPKFFDGVPLMVCFRSIVISSRTALCIVLQLVICSCRLQAEVYNGVEFPLGAASFADEVLIYDPLYSGGPAAGLPPPLAPPNALGPPNFVLPADHISLGSGGRIELGFVDNLLTNSGTPSPDLYVGEHVGSAERFFVAIRPTVDSAALLDPAFDANHDGYFELGAYSGVSITGGSGFVSLIDIDQAFPGFALGQLRFDAVQVVDDPNEGANLPGGTVGMDLEAVGAITAPVPEPSTMLLAMIGVLGLAYRRRHALL
jgi:hypothetical protein